MTLPSVCVLIPTFARTALLAEAIQCVARLTYKGPVHAVVFNDCPRQQLGPSVIRLGDPVRGAVLVNLNERCRSLAEKRHAMLKMTKADYVCFLDDDDLMMPWYLNALAANPEAPVILPKRQFRTDGDIWWDEVVPGGLWMIIERNLALTVGFTSGLDIGEDNAFRNSMIEKVGKQNLVWDPTPAYVYRSMIVGGMHISKATNQRAEPDVPMYLRSANQRMDDGREPTGIVNVVPAWREDYVERAKKLLETM